MSSSKVLVANRGEIAVRVMRTCRELGIATVAVYSEADRAALHVRMADEAVLHRPAARARELPATASASSRRRKQSGADAIHPGYGFLSENAEFAAACDAAGLVFIGPPAAAMRRDGREDRGARQRMTAAGVPVVPGHRPSPFATRRGGAAPAPEDRLPGDAQGGGRRRRQGHAPGASDAEDFDSRLARARSREAMSAFGDDAVYLEKYLDRPRHVEIQVLGDHARQRASTSASASARSSAATRR